MLDPVLLRKVGLATAAAAETAVAVLLGLVVGGWLDARFDTAPVFLFACSLAGLLIGFWRLSRWLTRSDALDGNDPQDPGP